MTFSQKILQIQKKQKQFFNQSAFSKTLLFLQKKMRILHTSDWHLGRSLKFYKFDKETGLFIDWLTDVIKDRKIDILLVCGDIFDSATPSNSVLNQYYTYLNKLKSSGLKHIVLIAGNHDSPATLKAPKDLLKFFNIHIIESLNPSEPEKNIIKIGGSDPELVIVGVPYPRERELRAFLQEKTFEDRQKALRERIAGIYRLFSELTENYRKNNIPVIATGHLFITESNPDDYPAENYIGGLTDVPLAAIPQNFDYIALGHIHKPIKVVKNKIHYSGSPLPYGFPEGKYKKKIFIIDTKSKPLEIQELEIPKFIDLVEFEGDFQEILGKISAYKTTDGINTLAMLKIKEKTFNPAIITQIENLRKTLKNITIVDYRIELENNQNQTSQKFERLEDLTPAEIFEKILENKNYSKEIFLPLFKEILDELNQ